MMDEFRLKQKVENAETQKDTLLTVIRIMIAFAFIWHAIPRFIDPSIIYYELLSVGFPPYVGAALIWFELIAAFFVLFGLWSQWANLALACIVFVGIFVIDLEANITAAVIGLHPGTRIDSNIWINLLILTGTLVLATFGPGRYAFVKDGFIRNLEDFDLKKLLPWFK